MVTTKRIKLINKKEFAKVILNENIEALLVYVTSYSLNNLTVLIHPVRKAKIALLIGKKMKISNKYSDFSDVFLEKRAFVLLKIMKLNQHAIK